MSLDRFSRLLVAAALAAPLPACSEAPATTGDGGGGGGGGETTTETGCAADADCAATPDTPLCDVPSGECIPLPPGHPLGWKDGSPTSVSFTMVFEPEPAQPFEGDRLSLHKSHHFDPARACKTGGTAAEPAHHPLHAHAIPAPLSNIRQLVSTP